MSTADERASGDRPAVLVVDDEANVARAYELWLPDDYDVSTANGGREALDAVDETVDVVLLDRRMPDLSGDDVLTEIRARGYDPRVAMVTAVDPDFDVVDMPFDAYLTKPVDQDQLTDTVERLVSLSLYSERVREHFALVEKRAALTEEMSERELRENEEFDELTRRIDSLKRDIDRTMAQVDEETLVAMFRDLGA